MSSSKNTARYSSYLNYIVWPLAIYGAIKVLNVDELISNIWNIYNNQPYFIDILKPLFWLFSTYCIIKLLKLDENVIKLYNAWIQFLGYQQNSTVQDIRSIIDNRKILINGRIQISILCTKNTKTGNHAFLLFERKLNNNSVTYTRADFGYQPTGRDSSTKLSDLSAGEVDLSVKDAEGLNNDDVLRWIDNKYYASFTYEHRMTDEQITEKFNSLKNIPERFNYSLSGDHESNKHDNNHNCATWCVKILKEEFGIDINLDQQFFSVVRSPKFVVGQAKKKLNVVRG